MIESFIELGIFYFLTSFNSCVIITFLVNEFANDDK